MTKLNAINSAISGTTYFAQKKQNLKNSETQQSNQEMRNSSNVLYDMNYGILQAKSLSFKGGGLPVPALNKVSVKVNNLFNILRANDLIIAAPNYTMALNSLKDNLGNINNVIKRVFFVEEKKLDRAIAFRKNLEDREAINLSEKPLVLKDNKNEASFLKKGESGYLLDGDKVNAGKYEISIKDDIKTALPIKDSFTYFFDADKDVECKIKEINEKTLSRMTPAQNATPQKGKIMFSDVGGIDNVIKELKKNILFPIKYPEIKNGKNMRKSILLYGAPGTGKSYVAEACANEAGAWFKKINASELDSKWVGESEQNWRNLFKEARENQPALIFIDEIDAIAKQRNGRDPYGDKTLNTILGLMSDSEKRGDKIYMLAATNRANMLDAAITRSGRFGLAIEVPSPDKNGIKDILSIYTKSEPLAKDFDVDAAAEKLYRYKATGSDIAAVAEDARTAALEREHIFEKMEEGTYTPQDMKNLTITNEDFDKAIDIIKNNKKTSDRKPIGFNSALYQ